MAKTLEEKKAANRAAQQRFWSKFSPEQAKERRKVYMTAHQRKEGAQAPSDDIGCTDKLLAPWNYPGDYEVKSLIVRAYDEIMKANPNTESYSDKDKRRIEFYRRELDGTATILDCLRYRLEKKEEAYERYLKLDEDNPGFYVHTVKKDREDYLIEIEQLKVRIEYEEGIEKLKNGQSLSNS